MVRDLSGLPRLKDLPDEPTELTREQAEKAKCDKSPTGFHQFFLSWQEDRTEDGACQFCGVLHSQIHGKIHHKKYKKGGKRRVSTTEGKITVKELAARAKVEPRVLRRLLRKSFGGGSRKTYVWEPNDPQVEEIIKAAQPKPEADKKALAEKKAEDKKAKVKRDKDEKTAVSEKAKAEKKPADAAKEAGQTETGKGS